MSNPRRIGTNGLPTSKGTLVTWNGIVERCKAEFGNLPLRSLVQDQQPVADFITLKLVTEPSREARFPALPRWSPSPQQLLGWIAQVLAWTFFASGHDRSVRRSVLDEAYRLEMSEELGTGFNVPSCTECTESEKEATETIAAR